MYANLHRTMHKSLPPQFCIHFIYISATNAPIHLFLDNVFLPIIQKAKREALAKHNDNSGYKAVYM